METCCAPPARQQPPPRSRRDGDAETLQESGRLGRGQGKPIDTIRAIQRAKAARSAATQADRERSDMLTTLPRARKTSTEAAEAAAKSPNPEPASLRHREGCASAAGAKTIHGDENDDEPRRGDLARPDRGRPDRAGEIEAQPALREVAADRGRSRISDSPAAKREREEGGGVEAHLRRAVVLDRGKERREEGRIAATAAAAKTLRLLPDLPCRDGQKAPHDNPPRAETFAAGASAGGGSPRPPGRSPRATSRTPPASTTPGFWRNRSEGDVVVVRDDGVHSPARGPGRARRRESSRLGAPGLPLDGEVVAVADPPEPRPEVSISSSRTSLSGLQDPDARGDPSTPARSCVARKTVVERSARSPMSSSKSFPRDSASKPERRIVQDERLRDARSAAAGRTCDFCRWRACRRATRPSERQTGRGALRLAFASHVP